MSAFIMRSAYCWKKTFVYILYISQTYWWTYKLFYTVTGTLCFFNVTPYCWKKPVVYISYIFIYQSNLLVHLKALLHCHQYTWIWKKYKNNIEYHNILVSTGWSPYVCFYNAVCLLLKKTLCIYFVYQSNLLMDLQALLHCHRYTWIWIKCKNNIEYHNSLVSIGWCPCLLF